MNKQKEEVKKILIALFVGDQCGYRSVRQTVDKLAERENRSFNRGMITGAILTAIVLVCSVLPFSSPSGPSSQNPHPIEQQLNDTLQQDQGDLSRDTSYKSYRKESPETRKAYDSSLYTTRGYLYKAADSMVNSQHLKSHHLTSGKAERRNKP